MAGAVDMGAHAHARRCGRTVAVQVRDDDRTAIELDHAEPPRHAFAIKQFVAVVQRRVRDQLAAAILSPPIEPLRQANPAGFARRILHRPAIAADLQFQNGRVPPPP